MANGDSRQMPDVEPLSHTGDTRELLPRRLASERASAPASEPAVAVAASPLPRATLDFRTIFELEIGYVMRTLRRLGVAPADLEDLAHDVFLAVHQRLDSYDPARALRPWLFGFAFRVASHYRRKAGRETALEVERVADVTDGPDALLEKEGRRQLVLAGLAAIELSRRAVFVLHELDGVTCDEIARTLEIPLGTAYSRLRLARQDFSAAMNRLRAQRVIE